MAIFKVGQSYDWPNESRRFMLLYFLLVPALLRDYLLNRTSSVHAVAYFFPIFQRTFPFRKFCKCSWSWTIIPALNRYILLLPFEELFVTFSLARFSETECKGRSFFSFHKICFQYFFWNQFVVVVSPHSPKPLLLLLYLMWIFSDLPLLQPAKELLVTQFLLPCFRFGSAKIGTIFTLPKGFWNIFNCSATNPFR